MADKNETTLAFVEEIIVLHSADPSSDTLFEKLDDLFGFMLANYPEGHVPRAAIGKILADKTLDVNGLRTQIPLVSDALVPLLVVRCVFGLYNISFNGPASENWFNLINRYEGLPVTVS